MTLPIRVRFEGAEIAHLVFRRQIVRGELQPLLELVIRDPAIGWMAASTDMHIEVHQNDKWERMSLHDLLLFIMRARIDQPQ